jgi:DNA-binding MarR family transcriptional regulator
MTDSTDTDTQLDYESQELSHLMPALWRTLVRVTRYSDEMPALESQVSVLRKLVDVGDMSPAQLADELHLARPTISNLIRGLVADEIVERRPAEFDGRSVVLTPTERGRQILDTFREGRVEALREALQTIPADDRQTIAGALESLEVLLHRLEEMSGGEPL